MKKNIILIFAIMLLCLSGCSNNQNNDKTQPQESDETLQNTEEQIEKVETPTYTTNGNDIQSFNFENHKEIILDGEKYTIYCDARDEYFNNIVVGKGNLTEKYEDYCHEIQSAYLLKMHDKKYIVVNTNYDNDYQITHLFDVTNNPQHIGLIDASLEDIQTDNDELLITGKFKLDIIGTYLSTNTYTIDYENDMFVLVGEIYDLQDMERELTLSQPLEVILEGDMVVTLDTGTIIKPIATDAIHTFYFLLEDGRQGYFEYEEEMQEFGNEEKWEIMVRTINGIPEEEIFENLPYAG